MANHTLPLIITFANQKGGVGKTTLCVCFANYLVSMGMKVYVVDCDRQQSISRFRKRDLEANPEATIPYAVASYRSLNRGSMTDIIKDIYRNHADEVVLFDCPGSLTEEWIIPLIGNSDALVIPYHYDNITISSTSEFILFIDRIRKSSADCGVEIFLIPNLHDKRIGTKEERERWERIGNTYSQYGIVTPYVECRAAMTRLSTILQPDSQISIVEDSFRRIYDSLF